MNPNLTFVIMLVGMFALMFFMQRSQKKQAEKRMESLNKLQKGYEVILSEVYTVQLMKLIPKTERSYLM